MFRNSSSPKIKAALVFEVLIEILAKAKPYHAHNHLVQKSLNEEFKMQFSTVRPDL